MVSSLVLIVLTSGTAFSEEDCEPRGSIKATLDDYDPSTEYFPLGSEIYLTGDNFNPDNGNILWEVRDMDNNKIIVSSYAPSLEATVNSAGTINPIRIFTIPIDDYEYHNYRVEAWSEYWETDCHLNEKTDDFHTLKDTFYSIPEFPVIALPVAIMLGLMFIITRKSNK